jgi:hypothetical protein
MKSKLMIESPVLLIKALSYTRQEDGITIFIHLPTGNAEQDSYNFAPNQSKIVGVKSKAAQGSHGSFTAIKGLDAFKNAFDNTGIMNCEGSSQHHINELSSLINIRSTMQSGWGANVFAKVKILNLSHSNLSATQLSPLFKSMYYQKMDMDLLDLSFNKMSDDSVVEMLWSIGNEAGKQIHSIRYLKINNNEFSDRSAEYLSSYLIIGSLKDTKVLDVFGNKITKTGEGVLVNSLLSITQSLKLVLAGVKDFSKESLKASMKSMLFIANNNEISTNETLTNDETIKHCKKGIPNVALNIVGGVVKSFPPAGRIVDIAEFKASSLTGVIGSLTIDDIGLVLNPIKKLNTFFCVTEEFTSIVDEDFTNYLVGVNSILSD